MAQIMIDTRDFGTVEISSDDIIEFESPIFGFEDLKRFVLLYEESNQEIVWLQSIENTEICFVLVDPSVVAAAGGPIISVNPPRSIGDGDFWVGLIVVVANEFQDSTVNLRSPVVVNLARRRGLQMILEEDYPIRYPLFAQKGERN